MKRTLARVDNRSRNDPPSDFYISPRSSRFVPRRKKEEEEKKQSTRDSIIFRSIIPETT